LDKAPVEVLTVHLVTVLSPELAISTYVPGCSLVLTNATGLFKLLPPAFVQLVILPALVRSFGLYPENRTKS
jgi:hypothetical protein